MRLLWLQTRTPEESAFRAMDSALGQTGLKLENIDYIVATGRGRSQVPFARKTVSEIACGAAGAVRIWGPSVRTVLDAGGQGCKVIQCTEKGRATAFLWNDKCAAGIGRSMEVFARLVNKEVTEIGKIALKYDKVPKIGDFCSVYAQSEALDLIRSKVPVEQIIAAYHHAMARRIGTLTARSGVHKDFVIIGGLAKNPGITERLESILKVGGLRLSPSGTPHWLRPWVRPYSRAVSITGKPTHINRVTDKPSLSPLLRGGLPRCLRPAALRRGWGGVLIASMSSLLTSS